jgi:hypothetical protein
MSPLGRLLFTLLSIRLFEGWIVPVKVVHSRHRETLAGRLVLPPTSAPLSVQQVWLFHSKCELLIVPIKLCSVSYFIRFYIHYLERHQCELQSLSSFVSPGRSY